MIAQPTDPEIYDAMSRDNFIVFYAEDPICILDYEVTKIDRVSESRFRVSVHTYETEKNLNYLVSETEIPISGYILECDIYFDDTSSRWKTDNWKDHEELGASDISTFPISDHLLSHLGELIIETSDPDDLSELDVDRVRPSFRTAIIEKLREDH
jgi:hypothetical protein